MATFVWTGASTTAWDTGANWNVAGVAQASPPTAADDAVFGTGTGATNNNALTTSASICRSLMVDDAYTGTLSLVNAANALRIGDASGGALRWGSAMTLTNLGSNTAVVLRSTSSNGGAGWSVTTNGKKVTKLQFSGVGGRWTLQDDITTNGNGGTVALRFTAGTVDANGKNVNVAAADGVTVDGATLIMGTGTWAYAAITVLTIFTYSSGTITGGSETHSLTGTGNNARTFAGGGQVYGTLRHNAASGTGALIVTGANTFAALGCVTGRTLTLPASTTTTLSGTNPLANIAGTLNSSSAGTAATISLTGKTEVTGATIKDSTVTQTRSAFAYSSTSVSGNTNWIFVDASISSSDTGSGADAGTIAATLSSSDTGSGTDAGTVAATLSLSSSETAAGSDAAALSAELSTSDTAAAVDAATLTATLTTSDTASGSDDSSAAAALSSAEVATSADAATLAATLATSDTAAVVDSATLAAALTTSDTASGYDDSSASATLTSAEVVTSTDDATLAAALAAAEQTVIDDAAAILAAAADVELAAGVDDSGGLLAALSDLDTAAGVDGQTLLVIPVAVTGDLCWTTALLPRWWSSSGEQWLAGVGSRWSARMGECLD